MQGIPMEVMVGVSNAEEELKEVLRRHRAINQLTYRQRTFDESIDPIFALNGFVCQDQLLECTYCHFRTSDWNPKTIEERHKESRYNCIFNLHE